MGIQYSQLTMDERNSIHRGLNEGQSCRAIAKRLNRPTSCVTREVARNTVGVSYDAGGAAVASRVCRRRGPIKLKAGSALWSRVRALMTQGWSPEQVAGRLRKMNPDDVVSHVSHETLLRDLCLATGRIAQGIDCPITLGAQSEETACTRGRSSRPTAEHDLDPHASHRGRRALDTGPLGRRFDQRGGKPQCGGHVGRAQEPVPADDSTGRLFSRCHVGSLHPEVPARSGLREKDATYDQGKEMVRHEELAKCVKIDI